MTPSRLARLRLIGAGAAALTLAAAHDPLAAWRDRARVLIVSAPLSADRELAAQRALLDASRDGMGQRDLVVLTLVGGTAHADDGAKLDAEAVRRAVGLRGDRFGAALVGKDGGVKLRRDRPIGPSELFRTIDAMPMRRNEMRRDEMRRR